jgi:hypothetical protein
MSIGVTSKQFLIERFFKILETYKNALESGTKEDIIRTSLMIYSAKGGVPKQYHKLVNKTFKETKRIKPL